MKYNFEEWISLVIELTLVLLLIVSSTGCTKERKSKYENYNQPQEKSESVSTDLADAITAGVNAGNNCNERVGGLKDETFDAFKSCVNEKIHEEGYNNFDINNRIKIVE